MAEWESYTNHHYLKYPEPDRYSKGAQVTEETQGAWADVWEDGKFRLEKQVESVEAGKRWCEEQLGIIPSREERYRQALNDIVTGKGTWDGMAPEDAWRVVMTIAEEALNDRV